jgi:hypothetical protein
MLSRKLLALAGSSRSRLARGFAVLALVTGVSGIPAAAIDITPAGASFSLPITMPDKPGPTGSYEITLTPSPTSLNTLILSVQSSGNAYAPVLDFAWGGAVDPHALVQSKSGLSSLLVSNFDDDATSFRLGTPSAATHYFTARISYGQLPTSFQVTASDSMMLRGSSQESAVPEPAAALVFAVGLLVVGRAVRQPRR